LSGGAPVSLVTHAELSALSTSGQTWAERCLARMQNTSAPMPPAPGAAVPSADVSTFSSWVSAGSPAGTCAGTGGGAGGGGGSATGGGTGGGTATGGGTGGGSATGGGGGTAPTTCASNLSWLLGNLGSQWMNPGYACQSCHAGNNFAGQNPNHASKQSEAMFFMGTVYGGLHEKNLCDEVNASSAKIEILDSNGTVKLTLTPNGVGNFYSSSSQAGFTLPYTARVTQNGKTRAMTTPQTSGDCNTCHTEQGLNGAPGRVQLPQ
jgi:hypothetical protein